jgi:hypothetical protein
MHEARGVLRRVRGLARRCELLNHSRIVWITRGINKLSFDVESLSIYDGVVVRICYRLTYSGWGCVCRAGGNTLLPGSPAASEFHTTVLREVALKHEA